MSKLNPLAVAIGAAVVSSTLSLSALAANPFQATDLSSGYQLADNHEKSAEGKCGEGKCGEGKCGGKEKNDSADDKKDDDKSAEGKCGEGKCAADMKEDKKEG